MSTRTARHRRPDRPDPSDDPAAGLLARLGLPRGAGTGGADPGRADPGGTDPGGWVPQRPDPFRGPPGSPGSPSRSRPPLRWLPARRAVMGLGLVVLVAVLVALLLVWRAQPAAEAAPRVRRSEPMAAAALEPAGSAATVAGTVATAATTAGAPAAEVVVHVVGAVHRPGLVRLPAGSRVADAVRAAGGTTAVARVASVNLARRLVDGEQLVVQRRGGPALPAAPGVGGVGAPGAAAGSSGPVDLNTATLEALDGLPGIGPVLAQRILDWRTAHERFSSVDELGEVSGIGEATLADLRPVVTV